VLALLLPNRDPQRQLDLLAELAARFADGRFRERIAAASCSRTVCNLLTAGLRA
jgi:mannitol/fructose-specific phosphotransferase system IIA component (Ntr-type)